HVALRGADAAAHVRVEREPDVLHQHLALRRLRQRRVLDAEIALAHPAGRMAGEQHPAVVHSAAKRARWLSTSPNSRASAVRRRKVWLIFSSSVIPMPPCSCTDSWLMWRAASPTLIFAMDTALA